LPHITWCSTGPLAFLPIHAAGCYDEPNSKIFDFAISSYTPTISALVASPQDPAKFRGILAIGQAETVGCAPLPGTIAELNAISKQAANLRFTQMDGDSATAAAVLSEMEEHSWVHLACHARQNTFEPTKSAFHIHGGTLDLATITRKVLKHASMAFLSACQTATGDEKLPDEAVHLAAGMIVAGYPTVIATMWSIQDSDTPLIAEKVYAHLLNGGVPDSRKAAKALHVAVECLRDKVGEKEFGRWVPYVHFGI
jgi:CHAT domain-containing protein